MIEATAALPEQSMPPVADAGVIGNDGEIGQDIVVQPYGFQYEFPANAPDDLFDPGVKNTGKTDPSGGRGTTQLAAALDQGGAHPFPACLNGRNDPGSAPAYHQYLGIGFPALDLVGFVVCLSFC